ncbi:cytochrome P450 4C1-like [Tachypleus tridentatus]|uniref:cytochrome P450 4C1-like n=1 Tax=Tachypleus tridentatus TaxID=6853 RepID=UPI003FD2C285
MKELTMILGSVPRYLNDWYVTIFLLCLSFVLTFIPSWIRWYKVRNIINKLPGIDFRNPFIGNVSLVMRHKDARTIDNINLLLFQVTCGFAQLFHKERIYRFWNGIRPSVAFFKPETIEVILRSSTILEKSTEYSFLHPWLGSGLLTSFGSKWRRRRKLVTPAFHFRILEDFIPMFNEQSQILVEKLRQAQSEKWVDIAEYVTLCTLDIICESAMGIKICTQENTDSSYLKSLYEVGETFVCRMIRPWLWPVVLFSLSSYGRRFKKGLTELHNFTRTIIHNRKAQILVIRASGNEQDDSNDNKLKTRQPLLDLMINHHLNDPSLTLEDIREEVDTFMFEGHDTTAMGISWTLYLIGLDSFVQKKIQDELDSVFGNDTERSITIEDIKQLKYMDCALKEGLRIFPPVPFIGRTLREDVVVNGYHIPQGSTCFLNIYMLHRNPDVFPNPETYDPDRFLPQHITGRHPYAYLPFSAGPRNCIGQKFAMMEEKVVIANILRNFNVTSLDPRDKIKIDAELVLRPKQGLRIRIEPRVRE